MHVRAGSAPSPNPTVYFFQPDFNEPAGGVRVIYRHTDILNSAGINAFVLHQRQGFRCTWFENATQTTSLSQASIRRGDVIVIPETDADLLLRLPAGTKHVIFNQNSHLTWTRIGDHASTLYSANPDLVGVVTVSSHNEEMLRYAFPGCPVRRIHLSIDPALFYPGTEVRPRRLTYMPRRGSKEARQVIAMLRSRGLLHGWELVELDGLSHGEVAEQLRMSRIFLAFTDQEGFGLPAAEAMACGNYVIGYHGFGGREFFLPAHSTSIEHGDVVKFVQAIEEVLAHEGHDDGWCLRKGRQASRFILSEYAPDREREEIIKLYRSFHYITAQGLA